MRVILIAVIAIMYLIQYIEMTYSVPVEYLLNSGWGFKDLAKVALIPIINISIALGVSSFLARKLQFRKLRSYMICLENNSRLRALLRGPKG